MTYSRPSTSTVSALYLPSKPQAMPAADRRVINVGANGAYMDFSSPQQAGINAGRGLKEVSDFLSKAVEAGAPIYKQYLQAQGNQQAGEFLKTVDVSTLYRNGDEDQRNLLRDLNPFAQQQVADAAAKATARTYIEVLGAERAKNTTLQNPYAKQEEIATAEAQVRSAALERSGLDRIPSAALAPYVGSVAEAEGSYKGDSYKQQLATKSADYDLQVERGLSTTLISIDETRKRVRDYGEGAEGSTEGWSNYKKGSVEAIQADHDKYVQGGIYTSKQYAERWWSAITKEYQKRVGNDDLPGASSLINTMVVMSDQELKTPGGVSLWDIKLGDGAVTIKDGLNRLNAEMLPRLEAWERKQLIKQAGPDLAAMAQGDEAARTRLEGMLPGLAKDPEALQSVVGMMGQMQSFSRTPTDAQYRAQQLLEIGLNNPNRDQKQFNQQVLGSNLTAEQKISLLNRNTQPQDPTMALVSQGAEYGKDELLANAAKITQAQRASGLVPAGMKDEDLLRRNFQDLQIAATRASEKRIKDLISAGETVTPMRAAEIFRNEQEAIRNTRMKEAKTEAPAGTDWNQRVMGEANYVQEQLARTGGKGTIALFPPSVIAASKAAGIPQDYRNVQRYFLNRLSTAKGPQGEPAFPDPQKAYQQMVRSTQPKPGSSGQGQKPGAAYQSLSMPERMLGKEGARALDGLIDLGRKIGLDLGGEAPKPQSKGQGDQSSGGPVKPQQVAVVPQQTQQLLTRGLEALMNVVAPPAMASEGPGGVTKKAPETVVNGINLPDMAKIWSGFSKLSAKTPPLPQVAATAMATPVGMAINNVMHPFFVAIGIAEGTRTPSGAFTSAYYGHRDPGSGARNVGTVSGQNGSSPQSVDRQWMGKLTQLQMRVAPMLQSLGVRPGTTGYNRLMFNVLDSFVQSPEATTGQGGFVGRLRQVVQQGITIEAIAKARADSYFSPVTGRLQASGFGNNYSRLLADQRSRAGAFDYKRRL